MLNRISYHNRLREKQFIEIFLSHGASVKVVSHTIESANLEALKTMRVDPAFAGMTHEELAVSSALLAVSFGGDARAPGKLEG